MEKEKYIAYVGTYTHGSSIGIHLYDVDVEEGTLSERKVVPVNNSSYVVKSKNGKYLYSIADEGVAVFEIKPDGDLELINKVGIDGMRGCYLCVDDTGKYLFVAGYHDGKITAVHTHQDGRLGQVFDGVFHKGVGSVAERNFRPHVSCVKTMWVYSRVVFRTVCRIRSGKAPWISCFYSWTVISSKKSKNIIR